jgi:excinuclease ABC subunit C
VRETLRLINQIFPIRKCHGRRLEKKRPCVYYQLGQCPAPCCCMVDPEEYKKTVRDVQLFLQGRSREVIVSLKKKMELESQALQYEQAARTRDRIQALEQTLEKQSMVSLDFTDRDVFSFYREGERMEVVVLFVRGGRLSGTRSFSMRSLTLSDAEALSSFLSQYYSPGKFIPAEVIIPLKLPDQEVLAELLREMRRDRVAITVPQQGPRYELLKMAGQNAEVLFRRERSPQPDSVLPALQEQLGLQRSPQRIVCFDISNIMGTAAVGSAVQFSDGRPDKAGYRRFRIKTVHQADDYGMMYEVLTRYLTRAQREGSLPDLIMVDGGRGQLGVLIKALADCAIENVAAISLAKAGDQRGFPASAAPEQDKICLPHRKNPLLLNRQSPVLLYLQRIRDEAHRFAITYHRKLKAARDLTSPLQAVPGIGVKRAQQLLRHFAGMERLREASLDELSQLPFLNKKTASLIYDFFRTGQKFLKK